jgi:hypothetical protein
VFEKEDVMSQSKPESPKHEPLDSEPGLMSATKRSWWAAPWDKRPVKQPRLGVFQYAMNSTVRPTAPNESVAYGYVSLSKFHDREPEAVLKAIEALDPSFFDSFPRRDLNAPMDVADKKAAIGDAARVFYRHGLAAYGKPGLRKNKTPATLSAPLAVI